MRCEDGSEFVGELVHGVVNWELPVQRARLDAVAAALFPHLPRSTHAYIRAGASAPTSMFIELRTRDEQRYAFEFLYEELLLASNEMLLADVRKKAQLLRLEVRKI